MRRLTLLLLVLLVSASMTAHADNPPGTAEPTALATRTAQSSVLNLTGVTSPIHDPTLIREGNMYYVFSTGQGIRINCSKDMLYWDNCRQALRLYPYWVYQAIPGLTDLWAPDVVYWDGKYRLYYSASTFGSNRSAIGLASNVTLDQNSRDYQWVDEGEVISSQPTDDYNAIDPNLVTDEKDQRWLVFGSFWGGIKMRKVDSATGKLAQDDTTLYSLARKPGNSAIEAGFITHRDDYYYLFVSHDFCCRGVNSTYKIMVGRSREITGPYLDRDGRSMVEGGGTLVYAGSDRWRGPGHNSIYVENDIYWMVYHSYDAQKNGAPTLRIEALQWDKDGWPVSPSAAGGE